MERRCQEDRRTGIGGRGVGIFGFGDGAGEGEEAGEQDGEEG